MKGSKPKVVPQHRWVPDPHRRHGIVASKKVYDRKKAPVDRREPSSLPGRLAARDGMRVASAAR